MFWMSESTSFSNTEQPPRFEVRPMTADTYVTQPQSVLHTGYSETLLYQDAILAIHLADIERTTMDVWTQRNTDLRLNWADITRPLFMLVAFDDKIEAITPYARQKAREMNMTRPELPTVVAVVVPNSVVGQMIKLLLWSLSQMWQATTLRIFSDVDEAQMWLTRQVDYVQPKHKPM
jgi:hypothetical protein